VSAITMLHPARWSIKPFGMAFTGLQPSRMPLSWERDAGRAIFTLSKSTHRRKCYK
jgi:hypothetical protein